MRGQFLCDFGGISMYIGNISNSSFVFNNYNKKVTTVMQQIRIINSLKRKTHLNTGDI
jgi:hypothetical protein